RLAAGEIDLGVLDDGLARYAAVARESGFRAFVTYSPSAYTAYDSFVHFHDPTLAPVMRSYSQRMRSHVAEICARLNLTFIDFTPALQAAGAEKRGTVLLYGLVYHHLTKAGNAVLADVLARALFGGTAATPPINALSQP